MRDSKMSSSAPTAADRGFTWSDEETTVLLQLWSSVCAQQTIVANGNNKKGINIFERVSEEMNGMGFLRSTSQCKEKIKRMKREYTLSKQKKQTGRNKKNMRFFELFEQILQTIQTQNSENTISKSDSTDKDFKNEMNNPKNKTSTVKSSPPQLRPRNLRKRNQPVEVEEDIPNPWSPDVVIVEEEIPPPSTSFPTKSSSSRVRYSDPANKIQKLNNESSSLSLFKTMMNSLSLKFLKYQTESEEKMLSKLEELEKDRSIMDERIQRMWKDFEERRQMDEREHELKMMSALQDIIKPISSATDQKIK